MEFKELFVIVVFVLPMVISSIIYGITEYIEVKIRHNKFKFNRRKNTKH